MVKVDTGVYSLAANVRLTAEDSGDGGLVRGRVEVPFIGSRKRQDRIISQAFQESSARKAMLDVFAAEIDDVEEIDR